MHVLIASHDPRTRDTYLAALQGAGIGVLPAPSDAAATLELTRRHRPAVVLLDDELPGLRGVQGLRRLADESPESHVVTIARDYEDQNGVRAVLAGAVGYLSHEVAAEALPRVVRAVMRGEAAISRALTRAVIEAARSRVGMRPVKSTLTPREWEVLDLMTAGASTAEISNQLVVALETVQSHVKHILRKLGVHSRAAAVAKADELRRH